MNAAGLGTLLFDLLTPEQEHHRANVFDIGLLAGVTNWLRAQPSAANAAIGCFGASTGATAAGLARDRFITHLARGITESRPV